MENIILSQFASSFEKQVDKKKGISDTVDQIDGVDNNVEEIVAGMKIHLPDGSWLVKRRVPKVIRSVRYSLKKDPELYYREQLMLFYPWREENALKGQSTTYEDEFKIHEAHIISFKAMFDAFTSDESIEEIFEDANQQIVNDEIDDIAPNARQTEDDSEQLRQDMESILQPADSSCTHYDIGQDIGCSNSAKRAAEIVIANKLSDQEYLELVRSLNPEQKCFFYYILNTTKTNDEPYYVFLSGGAGVGKSHVLKAIYQALLRYFDTAGENPDEIKVVIGAPTGKAAYNIKGNTLHSIFHIPASQSLKTYIPLDHSTLNTLRCHFAKLKVLIIDEVSMVGIRMFNFLSNRLQDIFGSKEPFGGISLLLVGDLFQLRPVLDQWIFSLSTADYGQLATNFWQDLVTFYELKTVMRQRDDAQFAHLLNRVREGAQTENDILTLSTRLVSSPRESNIDNYIHLFSSNALVDEHNVYSLSKIEGHLHVAQSSDYVIGDVTTNVRDSILNISKTLPPQKTQNLLSELPLKVSANYMMIQNVDIKDGLTNGASCQLVHIDVSNNKPILLWVVFLDKDIGATQRTKSKSLYKGTINPNWTPIHFITRQFQVGKYKNVQIVRKQFPLKPAAASTVHKCQGISLSNAAVSFKGRIQSHMVYVALSRVTSLQGLHLLDFNKDKITIDKSVKIEISRLRNEKQIVYSQLPLAKPKLAILCHNARSLHKHIDDYRNDDRIYQNDVIFIQETWAKKSDSLDHYMLNGFNLIDFYPHAIHLHRPHCGVFAYVKEGLQVDSIEFIEEEGIEGIQLTVSLSEKHYCLTSIYCHPSTNVDNICDTIHSVVTPNHYTVLLGDINIDQFKQTTQLKKLQSTMHALNLGQAHIDETTDNHSSIDHAYITRQQRFESGSLESYWSDHKILWFHIL